MTSDLDVLEHKLLRVTKVCLCDKLYIFTRIENGHWDLLFQDSDRSNFEFTAMYLWMFDYSFFTN